MNEPIIRCWEDGPDEPDDMGTMCMLERGHDGPHHFVREDEIMITLVGYVNDAG